MTAASWTVRSPTAGAGHSPGKWISVCSTGLVDWVMPADVHARHGSSRIRVAAHPVPADAPQTRVAHSRVASGSQLMRSLDFAFHSGDVGESPRHPSRGSAPP